MQSESGRGEGPVSAEMPPLPSEGATAPHFEPDTQDQPDAGAQAQVDADAAVAHPDAPPRPRRGGWTRLYILMVAAIVLVGTVWPLINSGAPSPALTDIGSSQRSQEFTISQRTMRADQASAAAFATLPTRFAYGAFVPVVMGSSDARTVWNIAITSPVITPAVGVDVAFSVDVTMQLVAADGQIGSARSADFYVVGGDSGTRYLLRFGQGCDLSAPKHFVNDVHAGYQAIGSGCALMPPEDARSAATSVVLATHLGEVAFASDGRVPLMAQVDSSLVPDASPFRTAVFANFGDRSSATGDWTVTPVEQGAESDAPEGFVDAWFEVRLVNSSGGSILPSSYVLGGHSRQQVGTPCPTATPRSVSGMAMRGVLMCVRISQADFDHPATRFGVVSAGRHLVFGE